MAIVSRKVFCGARRPFLLGMPMDGVVAGRPRAASAPLGHRRSLKVTEGHQRPPEVARGRQRSPGGCGVSVASYGDRCLGPGVADGVRLISGTERFVVTLGIDEG